jgi:hypothetical protein
VRFSKLIFCRDAGKVSAHLQRARFQIRDRMAPRADVIRHADAQAVGAFFEIPAIVFEAATFCPPLLSRSEVFLLFSAFCLRSGNLFPASADLIIGRKNP